MYKPNLLTIARHDPRKGIADLLEAYTLLNRHGINFIATIIGAGPLLNTHRHFARHLPNVSLIDSVSSVAPYLKSADIFILPSVEEGSSSLAILEAMATGLPIIATNIDGIPEDITHNKTGLLVPPHDPPALAAAITKLLPNPRLARRSLARRRGLARRLARSAKKTYLQKHHPIHARNALQKFLKTFHFSL
ncbi:MAG: glycosyltransferase family 4 protein [Candidatus Chisholmbacteria bacterium]|nr:glycosyltransferase family 4 protein [Candidatus Chisholmbacteria bacterium]